MAIIEAKEFIFSYTDLTSPDLSIQNLRIEEGECIVLCGKSGHGKSTFLRLLSGLIPEYYYGVANGHFKSTDFLFGQHSAEEYAQKVACVFQNPATQFFHRKVLDELVFPCENMDVPSEQIHKRLQQTVHTLQIEEMLEKDLLHCSGGERQRIAFATAMMQSPKLLVLDEPTANLDQLGIEMVKKQIETFKKQGITIIIAEHRLHYLIDIADRFLCLENGFLTKEWTSKELVSLSEERRKELGLRTLTPVTCTYTNQEDNMLKQFVLEEFKVGYGKTNLFQISQFSAKKGEIIGVVGRNGIGKTTLMLQLAGLSKQLGGKIYFNDTLTNSKEMLFSTSFILQEPHLQLFSDSVRKEILLGNQNREELFMIGQKLNLTHVFDRHPMTLSGGEQQRVMLANAILAQKEIVILDEPTSGLDYEQMMVVVQLLKQLAQEEKLIFVISHDREFLQECCHRIWNIEQIASKNLSN